MSIKEKLYENAVSGHQLATYIEMLKETGELEKELPEIFALIGMPHDFETHPESPNVFGHVMSGLRQSTSSNPIANLAYLFHDVGKAVTHGTKSKPDGTMKNTYYGHDVKGMDIVQNICERLDISEEHTQIFKFISQKHMLLHLKTAQTLKKETASKIVNTPYWDVLKEAGYMDEMARAHLADSNAHFEAVRIIEEKGQGFTMRDIVGIGHMWAKDIHISNKMDINNEKTI